MQGLKGSDNPSHPLPAELRNPLWDASTKRGAVIDPGGDVDRILEAVGKVGARIEKILPTHGHIDHAGGAAALRDALVSAAGPGNSIPIEGPDERDRFLLEGLAQQGRAYGILDARDVLPDRWLAEGDKVTMAGARVRGLPLPRATRLAHVVLVQRGRCGSRSWATCCSVARSAGPISHMATVLRCLSVDRDKLLPLGDDVAFMCGHGPGFHPHRPRVSDQSVCR